MSTIQTPAPGWYPDPAYPAIMRWWDGHAWTAYTQQTAQTLVVHQDRGKRVNHVLHAILTVLTMGLWLPVWLIVAIAKN